jgi:hypothetical protein
VRRADDPHVETVGVVPPVVERRRHQHGGAAPGRQKCAQRSGQAPDAHARVSQRRLLRPGRREDQIRPMKCRRDAAGVDRHVRSAPERVAADRAVPGDVPVAADVGGRHGQRGTPQVPRNRRIPANAWATVSAFMGQA